MVLDNYAKVYISPGPVQNEEGTIVAGGDLVYLKKIRCNLQTDGNRGVVVEEKYGITGNSNAYIVFTKRDPQLQRGMHFEINGVRYEIRDEVFTTTKSRHQEWTVQEVVR